MPAPVPPPARDHPFRLGTRASPLAMAQANETRARLAAAHGWPVEAIELVPVTASGDRILDRPLADIGGKALWTRELDEWLLGGEIDAAVHSAKDVETLRPAGLAIAAFLPREDVRDVLVGAAGVAALPKGARIGTSAPRRAAQLLHARPDCIVVPFRGNVATRLAKLERGEADATLLARAGLNRLGLHDLGTPLPAEHWLPAPGQGAIAIEARTDDAATRALLAAIDHPETHAAVRAERALLAALGGNCHSPIAVLTRGEAGRLHMAAALFSPDGTARIDGALAFDADDIEAPARLAAQLLAGAAPGIAAHFTGPA